MSNDDPDDRRDEPNDDPFDDVPAPDPDVGDGGNPDVGDVRDPNAGDEEDDHWLSSLLSALEGLEDASTSRRRRSGRSVFDVDLSVRSVDDLLDGGGRTSGDPFADRRSGSENRDQRGSDSHQSRRKRRRSSNSARLATRRYDDELLLTADVADADPDDVTVGFDGSTLVVRVSGREIGRLDVPWDERTTEAGIRNGVLTVRVEPEGNDG
ncbi:Hsp20/alpha crystallin family protein [Natrarchaeobius chitinivorans]|uniref:Hsp20/alpha crystallin family protein n=1 Tax=Natrarchaeobius chitinivorans TaxID=1679083 RepID=A0A3N6NBB2_NATCH|nr:Hsp20/alpha crystallin family protein [Natrarchaeobius chitinivorans]RQG95922.1 Hsp20/alpha crystallin family protein [Natrarchaeobius chitinivorans]